MLLPPFNFILHGMTWGMWVHGCHKKTVGHDWWKDANSVTVKGCKYSVWTSIWKLMEMITLQRTTQHAPRWRDKCCRSSSLLCRCRYCTTHGMNISPSTRRAHLPLIWCWCGCGGRGFIILFYSISVSLFPYSLSGESFSVCLFTTYKELLQNDVCIWFTTFSDIEHILRGPRIRLVLGPFLQRTCCTCLFWLAEVGISNRG